MESKKDLIVNWCKDWRSSGFQVMGVPPYSHRNAVQYYIASIYWYLSNSKSAKIEEIGILLNVTNARVIQIVESYGALIAIDYYKGDVRINAINI